MDTQELLELKARILKAKEEVDELKGKRNFILDQLRTKFNCDSIEQAEQLLEREKSKQSSMSQKIEESIQELKVKYDL